MNKLTIHSGGAQGSDLVFGNLGILNGFNVIHHSFKGHKVNCSGEVIKHDEHELSIADELLYEANKTLKRCYPPLNFYVKKLLQRNFYQIKDVANIIAVAPFESENIVKGGTSWAVEMGRQLNKTVYVLDHEQTNKWYISKNGAQFILLEKDVIINFDFAGIGTRNLSNICYNTVEEILQNKIIKVI